MCQQARLYIMFKKLYSSICLNFNFNQIFFFFNLIEVFTTLNSNSVQYYFISLLYIIHYFYYDNLDKQDSSYIKLHLILTTAFIHVWM